MAGLARTNPAELCGTLRNSAEPCGTMRKHDSIRRFTENWVLPFEAFAGGQVGGTVGLEVEVEAEEG